ncbi:MAG: hypothetical protein ABJA98_10445 [Acidobacteriota bacterium]
MTGDEARAVLQELLSAHPTLIPDAEQVASAVLATVSSAAVADDVFEAIHSLDLDDLDAGPRAGGYVEPSEAAWEAVANAMKPYLDDLERRIKLRRDGEALEVCAGIVAGLYRAERSGSELLEYAEDCPSEIAGQAVDRWRRRRRDRTLPRTFVEKFAPEWEWLVR